MVQGLPVQRSVVQERVLLILPPEQCESTEEILAICVFRVFGNHRGWLHEKAPGAVKNRRILGSAAFDVHFAQSLCCCCVCVVLVEFAPEV